MVASSARVLVVGILAGLAPKVDSHATGQLYCRDAPVSPHETVFSTDTAPFTIQLKDASGNTVTAYTPGASHTWSLSATSTTPIGGFIVAAFSGSAADVGTGFIEGTRVGGPFTPSDTRTQVMLDDGVNDCSMGLTHTDSTAKTSVTAQFTAPASGTGDITFFSIVVPGEFDHPYRVYASFSEGTAAAPSGTPTPTPTPTNPSKASTPSKTPTKSMAPSKTASPTKTATKTSTKTKTGTPSNTKTRAPTKTATKTVTSSKKPKA